MSRSEGNKARRKQLRTLRMKSASLSTKTLMLVLRESWVKM